MRKLTMMAMLFLVAALAGAAPLVAHAAPPLGTAASPELGEWLPSFGDGLEPWRQGRATRVAFHDRFVYEGQLLPDKDTGGPSDGRYFVYGTATPVRAKAVYDPSHGLAFYGRGCCTYYEQVLAAGVHPPPVAIPSEDLTRVHTERGIRLGDAPSRVTRIFGRAPLQRVAGHPDVTMLAYTTAFPFAKLQGTGNACGWFQNFAFRAKRLVAIDFTFGC